MESTIVSSHASPPGITSGKISQRLLSLDFMRGFIMVLLASEACGFWENLFDATKGNFLNGFFLQFFHHPWNGLRFWDLIQPGFMYMAGVSMAYSLNKQWASGVSWKQSFKKIIKRCCWLFFWCLIDYSVWIKGFSFDVLVVLMQ